MKTLPLILGSLTLTLLPLATFAQTAVVNGGVSVSATPLTTSANVSSNASANTSGVSVGVSSQAGVSLGTVIARGDAEIDRRITNLNDLATRISQMQKVSASEQATLTAGINTQIANLTSLKATIDGETTLSALRTSVESITQDYRIYMLILPQGRIAAASDRIETIVADMQALEPKLSARIAAAKSADVNVSAAQSAYADMQTQVSNASADASAAVSETVNLTPDQGNTTIEASNTAAIKGAVSQIMSASTDLQAARADIATIVTAVKGTGSASDSVTTSANTSTP